MSLSRKFKQAVVQYYNPTSPWLLVPILLSGGFAGYGAGSAVYESPSEKPLAPLTQEATAREKAVLGQHLALVGKAYKDYAKTEEAMQKAEEALPQADDVTAARDKLAQLTMDRLEARFRLDDQTQKFQHFALQKTYLPEATIDATVASYASQWTLPAEVTISYAYRDEVRAGFDPAGLSASTATQKMHSLTASKAADSNFGTGAVGLVGFLGGMVSSFLALGIGGDKLRTQFRTSLWREEDEERERQREIERLEKEKQRALELANNPPAPPPPVPAEPETPAPAPVSQKPAQQFRL